MWKWHSANGYGLASPEAVEGLWSVLHERLVSNPLLFEQGWSEAVVERMRPKPAMMHVVHAVCMLAPPIAADLLIRLSGLPGFDVEQRTENGVTPIVAATYNRSPNRVVLLRTLLDLGANPNSPADMIEKPNSRAPRQRKSALAHLFSPNTPIFGHNAAFPARVTVDTESIQELVERGGHFGASYSCRKAIRVVEYRQDNNGRYLGGHCLPAERCYRTYGRGHAYVELPAVAARPTSPSVVWLEKLLNRHCTRVGVKRALAGRPGALGEAFPKVKFRWQLPSPFQDTMLGIRSTNPRLPVYGPIKDEVWALLYCLRRTSFVPDVLHALLVGYVVGSYPYVGFYDATRLERWWQRQRSPYIDTGYVVRFGEPNPGDEAAITMLERDLHETMAPIRYGQHPQVTVPADGAIYRDVAIVAAGLYGITASIQPAAYKRVISRKFTRVGGHDQNFWAMMSSPEEVQHELIEGYVRTDRSPSAKKFARWLCTELLRSAVRRVYESLKTGAKVSRSAVIPLTPAQVKSISDIM